MEGGDFLGAEGREEIDELIKEHMNGAFMLLPNQNPRCQIVQAQFDILVDGHILMHYINKII